MIRKTALLKLASSDTSDVPDGKLFSTAPTTSQATKSDGELDSDIAGII
jgi:hypothetical protein